MSDDLISRQAAIDELKEHRALYCDNTPDTFSKLSYAEKSRVDELDTAIATLVNLPSAQPQTGRWIDDNCSECGQYVYHGDANNYCPNCGAKMESENKVARGGELSRSDVECLKDLAKTKMAILTNEAMENEGYDGYSRDGDMDGNYSNRGRMYYDGGYFGRYGRGRGSNAKRDSMGRYSSRGYSYAEAKEDMIAELKELAKKAPDEKTKQELEHFANEMESK